MTLLALNPAGGGCQETPRESAVKAVELEHLRNAGEG